MTMNLRDRRTAERRVDKTTMKVRLTAGALRRTVGLNVAKRYLERNGYSDASIDELMQGKPERRTVRRRFDNQPARFQATTSLRNTAAASEVFEPLTGQEIHLLFRLRWATDSGSTEIRASDFPPRFAHFGLMESGSFGIRITERGRAALLHWTRAKALFAVSQGIGMHVYDEAVQTWPENNRFIAVTEDGVTATPRGLEWIASHMKTLTELACGTPS